MDQFTLTELRHIIFEYKLGIDGYTKMNKKTLMNKLSKIVYYDDTGIYIIRPKGMKQPKSHYLDIEQV